MLVLRFFIEHNYYHEKLLNQVWQKILGFQYSFGIWIRDGNQKTIETYLYFFENYKKPPSAQEFIMAVDFLIQYKQTKSLLLLLKNHPKKIKIALATDIKNRVSDQLVHEYLNTFQKPATLFTTKTITASKIFIDLNTLTSKYYIDRSMSCAQYIKPINFFLKHNLKSNKKIKNSYSFAKLEHIVVVNEVEDGYNEKKFLDNMQAFLDFYFCHQQALLEQNTFMRDTIMFPNVFSSNHSKIIKDIWPKFSCFLHLNENLSTTTKPQVVIKV